MLPLQDSLAEPEKTVRTPSLQLLIDSLSSSSIPRRRRALRALIGRGPIAVAALAGLCSSPREHVRWEAAKALGRIGGLNAAETLARVLDDESLDVRWTAADGLIAIGHVSLVPVLRILIERSNSVRVREGATHVLRGLLDELHMETILPVLSAMKLGVPVENLPVAAYEALNMLRSMRRLVN
jgi:HEAT repeat protein